MHPVIDLILNRKTEELKERILCGKHDINGFIDSKRTALSWAAACNRTEIIQMLIELGADVNQNNAGDLGYTPLEEACREGKTEAIKLLIDAKADIDKGNTINSNPLIGACIGAHTEIVKLLLANGADINHADNSGESALHYLCRSAKSWGSATITQTINGVTQELENPRFKQHTAVFELLLEHNIIVNIENIYGYTPLHLVAETDTHEWIPSLVAKGADINYGNMKAYTPLHCACDNGNVQTAKILIEHGADIDAVDVHGITPLLAATNVQNVELVRYLVARGAEKDIPANISYGNIGIGEDCIAVARKTGNEELIDALE